MPIAVQRDIGYPGRLVPFLTTALFAFFSVVPLNLPGFAVVMPAFALMAKGVGQYMRLKERDKRAAMMPPGMQSLQPPQSVPPVLPRRTDELRPPVPSVTEGTTRHLGVEAPTRHLETQERE